MAVDYNPAANFDASPPWDRDVHSWDRTWRMDPWLFGMSQEEAQIQLEIINFHIDEVEKMLIAVISARSFATQRDTVMDFVVCMTTSGLKALRDLPTPELASKRPLQGDFESHEIELAKLSKKLKALIQAAKYKGTQASPNTRNQFERLKTLGALFRSTMSKFREVRLAEVWPDQYQPPSISKVEEIAIRAEMERHFSNDLYNQSHQLWPARPCEEDELLRKIELINNMIYDLMDYVYTPVRIAQRRKVNGIRFTRWMSKRRNN